MRQGEQRLRCPASWIAELVEHLVVDVSYSRHPNLRRRLARSTAHRAVIVDTFAMEPHKSDNFEGLLANYAYLATCPKQVVILHPTGRLLALKSRAAGTARRMGDEPTTRGFASFCTSLGSAAVTSAPARGCCAQRSTRSHVCRHAGEDAQYRRDHRDLLSDLQAGGSRVDSERRKSTPRAPARYS